MSGGVIVAIVVSSVCLALFLGGLVVVGRGSFMVAALLSLVTLVPMMTLVMALDSLEPEPRHLLAATFLWGAGAAVLLSLGLEVFGGATLSAWGAGSSTALVVVVAPAVEESMKGLAVLAMFWFRRHQVNGLTDGVVYAATSALGFAAAENIAYYVGAAQDGGGASVAAVFVARGVLSPFCHPVFTAMTGLAIALAVRARGAARGLLPVGGLLLAMLLHGIWNGLTTWGIGGFLVGLMIMGGVLIGIVVALIHDRRQTVAQIQWCLRGYLPTGLVTGTDLAMLATAGARQRARAWATSTRGAAGLHAMRDYQQACVKLTMLHDRARLGLITPYEFERQRWLLLTLMRFARDAFLGPAPRAAPVAGAPWAQRPVPQPWHGALGQAVPPPPSVPQPWHAPLGQPVPPPQYASQPGFVAQPPHVPPSQYVAQPHSWPQQPPRAPANATGSGG